MRSVSGCAAPERHSCRCGRALGRRGGASCTPSLLRADTRLRVGARSPDSQAPPTVPNSVSCAASPAKKMRSRIGSIRMRREGWRRAPPPRKRPSRKASIQLRRLAALNGLPHIGTKQAFHPLDREGGHLLAALGRKLAAERARDIDIDKRRPETLASKRRCVCRRLLEHQIVALRARTDCREFPAPRARKLPRRSRLGASICRFGSPAQRRACLPPARWSRP